ncbi:MAG: hypothetical protein F4Y16_10215 [Holophagales bacterium]|nr:hypothetical protein [Holophagales bacterium]MYH23970.1 hypothetical protein [Holophagales bacterium]
MAVLAAEGIDPVSALVASWPSEDALRDMPLADEREGVDPLGRSVPVEDFVARVRVTRGDPYSWTLSSTMTDLQLGDGGKVEHAPLDPPVPKGLTLFSRMLRVHALVQPTAERIADGLSGRAVRVQGNGLGFDLSRLGSLADSTDPQVEPMVELLAFFGLALFPVRGPGVAVNGKRSGRARAVQRGWKPKRDRNGSHFVWPVWRQLLDSSGIDALLDAWKPEPREAWQSLGVHAAWRTVEFQRRAERDPTRGFGAEPL